MKQYIYILIICLFLFSCSTKRVAQPAMPPVAADTTAIPSFPAAVLYVLGAQWELDSTLQAQMSIGDYIEQRLIELYPEKAYKGYIDRIDSVANRLLVRAHASSFESNIALPTRHELSAVHPLKSSQQSTENFYRYLDSVSIDQELTLLELTPNERAVWDSLQFLVHAPQVLTRESFDTLDISSFEQEDVLISLLLSRGSRMFFRVLQSKSRAEKLAYYYYGDATNNGRPGDAFKHIYVNVLLRTYVGEWLAHAIMDVFWEWKSPNAPCDKYMDLHNNIIGRSSRYNHFTAVDQACNVNRHWLQWAEHVQHFITDSINGDLQAWDKETPQFIVEPAAKKVSAYQYIYWDK